MLVIGAGAGCQSTGNLWPRLARSTPADSLHTNTDTHTDKTSTNSSANSSANASAIAESTHTQTTPITNAASISSTGPAEPVQSVTTNSADQIHSLATISLATQVPAEAAPPPLAPIDSQASNWQPRGNAPPAAEPSMTVGTTFSTLADASPIAPMMAKGTNSSSLPLDLTQSAPGDILPVSASEPTIAPSSNDTNQVAPVAISASRPTLELRIENVRPQRGPVKVAVFTDPAKFLSRDGVDQAFELPDTTNSASTSVHVTQTCAIAVFQDINGDGELTKNRLGIPVEPCAFSNGAVIHRGPPKFADAAIQPSQAPGTTTVNIRLP